MFGIRTQADGRAYPLSLCHILCLCATWIRLASAFPDAATTDDGIVARASDLGLIPSGPRSNIIPSVAGPPQTVPSHPIATFPSEIVPLGPPQPSGVIPSAPPDLIPSAPAPSDIVPSTRVPTSNPGQTPSTPITDAIPVISPSQANATRTPVMQSTDQGLKPIPPAATQIGDPNGHHEITEPNFSATRPCRGCSPVVEMSATGWLDSPAEEQHGSTVPPAKITISAGPSNILLTPEPSGGNFVIGGSTTLTPGQTITVDDTLIAIQTSAGRTQVVVGSSTISLKPDEIRPHITDAPIPIPLQLLPVLTIGTQTITANAQTQYIIADQTLKPGGGALVIAGTTLSLAPSATAVLVNGETSTLTPPAGAIYTTTVPAALTLNNNVYTANRAGYILLGPGTTLIPGGYPITVDGTTLSLGHSGTAIVIQGTTKTLDPVTTIVTLTRPPGMGGGIAGQTSGSNYVYPTEKPVPGTAASQYGYMASETLSGGWILLLSWCLGYIAIRL